MTNTSAQRTILITGCSSGIGLDAALTLQQRGYRVIATVRNIADAEPLQEAGIAVIVLDYADEESIRSAIDQLATLTGKQLFAVFNNGAYGQVGALEDLSTAALKDQFEANFFGWHTLTHALIPWMRAAGEGRIIQCSSVLGIASYPFRGAYNASKHALEAYSDTLRQELRGSGIRVVLIQPGPIATKFRENALLKFREHINTQASAHHEAYAAQVARLTATDKVGGMTLAASAVTGKVIKALESPNPRPRYRVTYATTAVELARRLLTSRQLDWFIRKTN